MKVLSKSIFTIFLVDVCIFILATLFSATACNFSIKGMIVITILYTLIGIFVLSLKGYYQIREYKVARDSALLLEGLIIISIPIALLMIFFPHEINVFKFLSMNLGIIFAFIWLARLLFYLYGKNLKPLKNVLIIGAGNTGITIADAIKERDLLKFNVIGFIDNDKEKHNTLINGIKVLGDISDLSNIIAQYNIKLVVIAIKENLDIRTLMKISNSVPKRVSIIKMPLLYEKITKRVPIKSINADWFMYNFTNLDKPFYELFKRIFDIVVACIVLLVTFPIMLIIALLIKIMDGGNILYSQSRIGKDGVPFRMYKIRTMRVDADKAGMVDKGNTTDDRIIPHCNWIRQFRFDELPQMINILKGEMSTVGPRAEFEEFAKVYEKEIPFYSKRHWIKPGLSGWAQIKQGHCVTVDDVTEKLGYDFYYIKHRNIFWDLTILLQNYALALSKRLK